MQTAVVHFGALGDFVLALPWLAEVSRDGPVTLMGNRDILELAVAGGLAESSVALARRDFPWAFSQQWPLVREVMARVDRCVVWMPDGGIVLAAIRRCGVRDVRVWHGWPNGMGKVSFALYYLARAGILEVPKFRLAILPSELKRDVLLHPGAKFAFKEWPRPRFEELACELEAAGRVVTWVLGPSQEDVVIEDGREVLRPPSVVELARACAAARLYIGNDTGSTHVAGVVGCSTVAVFGSTDPNVWAPIGERVRVVHRIPWPGVADVLDGVACLESA